MLHVKSIYSVWHKCKTFFKSKLISQLSVFVKGYPINPIWNYAQISMVASMHSPGADSNSNPTKRFLGPPQANSAHPPQPQP